MKAVGKVLVFNGVSSPAMNIDLGLEKVLDKQFECFKHNLKKPEYQDELKPYEFLKIEIRVYNYAPPKFD